jgi:hypothetical protein
MAQCASFITEKRTNLKWKSQFKQLLGYLLLAFALLDSRRVTCQQFRKENFTCVTTDLDIAASVKQSKAVVTQLKFL